MTGPMRPDHAANRERAAARRAALPACAGLVVAFPVATWWLGGDLSTVPASADPDFAFRPFDIGPAAERAAGVGSVLLVAVTLLAWALARSIDLVHRLRHPAAHTDN